MFSDLRSHLSLTVKTCRAQEQNEHPCSYKPGLIFITERLYLTDGYGKKNENVAVPLIAEALFSPETISPG